MTVNNLPRTMRYKRENVIIVGIIPGPKEPKLTINSFLRPLVNDLKKFWTGVFVSCDNHPLKCLFIRAALVCCACDIPATRKLCGFMGHTAALGCSKCLKSFSHTTSTIEEGHHKMDYSGYDQETWPVRSFSVHCEQRIKYLHAKIKSEQNQISTTYGVRYSCLIDLPYFNPIRYAVIDPMHNLYLGTSKYMMELWTQRGILANNDFTTIEEITAKITTPRDIGRIPLKIGSSFSGFTSDQWRNWTTVLSPVALKQVLPPDSLRCWLMFVRACSLLSSRVISVEAVSQAHCYLTEFCKQVELIYGSDACTPNMHLHLHLKDCLLDYGPVHAFWCYAFERFNGVLGSYHTNSQSIETQLMRKFIREQQILSIDIPSEASHWFDLLHTDYSSGSLLESCLDSYSESVLELRSLAGGDIHSDYSVKLPNSCIKMLPPIYEGVLTTNQVNKIQSVYTFLYPQMRVAHFSHFYEYSNRCIMAGEIFTTSSSGERSSVITAIWPTESLTDNRTLQVGCIKKFIYHTVKVYSGVDNTVEEKHHVFCFVEWYIKHSQENWFGVSAKVCYNITYAESACSYIPIQRLAHRCAYGKINVTIPPRNSEELFIAIPIELKYSL